MGRHRTTQRYTPRETSDEDPLPAALAALGTGSVSEPEVVPAVPQRRRFTADYKAGIVEEADAC